MKVLSQNYERRFIFSNFYLSPGNGELQQTAVRALRRPGNSIPSAWARC